MVDVEEGHNIGKTELKLYRAALSNDWKKAERIYEKTGIQYGAKITLRGETALHIAALAGHTDFVQNLVQKMDTNEINLEMKTSSNSNERGNTAFHCAAISGNVKTAKAIRTRVNLRRLVTARGNRECLPIYMAAAKGNKEMVRFLYDATKFELEDVNITEDSVQEFKTLLITLIKSEIYDVALELAKELLKPRICQGKLEEEALKELAQKHFDPLGFFDRCIYPLLHRDAMDKSLMNRSATKLVQLLWNSLTSDETKVQRFIQCRDGNVIIEAAKQGNFEFLSILIASNPHVLFSYDNNRYTIFHHAILNRHVEVFELIHIGSVRTVVTTFRDKEGNNMLHLAGKLAPPNRLNIVPGAALQLQLELLWFEEVKKVMEPHEVNRKISSLEILDQLFKDMETVVEQYKATLEATNTQKLFEKLKKVMETNKVLEEYTHLERDILLFEELKMVIEQRKLEEQNEWTRDYDKVLLLFKEIEGLMGQQEFININKLTQEYTPYDIFVKEHERLLERGEKWMRDTANSCMIVSALITTIAFAAAITIPGGNADDGYPQFFREVIFKIFAIADSVSLVSSVTSLLGFLSILTSRYTMDDFRWSLPNKLVIGLATLFVSIVAMMVAFVMSIFIIFKDSPKLLAVVIAAVSSLPIILFTWQHLWLFVDVFHSTYTSFLLFKSRRDPYLLIKERKKKRKSLLFL